MPEPAVSAPADAWLQIFDRLRARFPTANEGVLFCIHKLQQNPDVRLRDFKHEAALHRVPMSGRSFHSARVLLGLEAPLAPRARTESVAPRPPALRPPVASRASAEPVPAPAARVPRPDADVESPVIAALKRFQAESAAESERLRAAVRRAIEIIDAALAGD